MSYIFGDGFDPYAAVVDMGAGYWDSVAVGTATLTAGRFAGSQALIAPTTGTAISKSSAINDAVHHITVAFRQTTAMSGTNIGIYFQLSDAATNQCCICFRSDGVILFTSATPAGTVLATYSGAVTASNTWFAFEFEIIINNTTGRFRARKNGNTVDDFDSGAVLNTRPGVNSYANKLTIAVNNSTPTGNLDDLLWRSDATSLAWLGDIRCFTRMPASDASAQFARSPATVANVGAAATTVTDPTGTARYTPFVPALSGTVGTLIVNISTGFTGNIKCSIFSDSGNSPAAVLGSATILVNPISGNNTFTFGTPVAVTKGVTYWWGVSHDVSVVLSSPGVANVGKNGSITYAAFPSPSPAVGSTVAVTGTVNITPTISADYVNEAQQDGTTTYVYDATAGHADLYNLAALSPAPVIVHAVTTRGFVAKSDAGTRTGAMQLRSGAITTTWNPADKDAAMTLSNGNLTAMASGTGAVRGTSGQNGGKFYWEITATTFLNAASFIGLATAAAVFANGYSQSGVLGITRSALVYRDNTAFTSLSTIVSGTVVCFAVDFTNKLWWIKLGVAAQWNESGTANPATGVGGYATGTIGGGTVAYPYFYENGAGDAVTANFGGSAFVGAVPAGFASGFGAAGTTVASPTLALSSSFLWAWRTDTLNPATSTAWTPAAVDAIQTGPLVVS